MNTNTIRAELSKLEKKLYSAKTPDAERSELSIQVSIVREQYARALRVTLWTATAVLESAGGDEEIE